MHNADEYEQKKWKFNGWTCIRIIECGQKKSECVSVDCNGNGFVQMWNRKLWNVIMRSEDAERQREKKPAVFYAHLCVARTLMPEKNRIGL